MSVGHVAQWIYHLFSGDTGTENSPRCEGNSGVRVTTRELSNGREGARVLLPDGATGSRGPRLPIFQIPQRPRER